MGGELHRGFLPCGEASTGKPGGRVGARTLSPGRVPETIFLNTSGAARMRRKNRQPPARDGGVPGRAAFSGGLSRAGWGPPPAPAGAFRAARPPPAAVVAGSSPGSPRKTGAGRPGNVGPARPAFG